ncbi:MAG: hypothetical protein H0X45_12910 [Planctomycetes bacterium]|nr:hypothetical protein [Planctomycetota bacterium]
MTIAVAHQDGRWYASHSMGGRTLSMGLTFAAEPVAGAEVVVEKTGAESPFFSQSRVVAECMQGVGQALAEARVQRWVARIDLRDSDAAAPAQAMYLACAITRKAIASGG